LKMNGEQGERDRKGEKNKRSLLGPLGKCESDLILNKSVNLNETCPILWIGKQTMFYVVYRCFVW